MPTAYYDAYSAPLAERRAKKQLDAAQEELEFSEYGRSPTFGPGWYIVPLLLAWPFVLLVWLI